MPTGARGTGPVSPRDLTGTRDRELRASAAERKEIQALTPDEYFVRLHEARSQGHKAGFTEGHLAGFNAALNLIVDAGLLTEDAVLTVTNAPEDVE
jgi:hypothetical protein